MSFKLNQVIAIVEGEKKRKHAALSKFYQTFQQTALFDGLVKTYEPFEEDPTGANQKPPEYKNVLVTVKEVLSGAMEVLENMFNLVATQDIGNCSAKGTIKVDDKVIAADVPVTHLLFLEKQLTDIETFFTTIPTLDASENWDMDTNSGWQKSEPKKTVSTKKVMKNHVKAVATDKHPAQVDVYTEDVPVGTFETVKFSGAIKSTEKAKYIEKVRKLATAVKLAREEANMSSVDKADIGTKVIQYLFS